MTMKGPGRLFTRRAALSGLTALASGVPAFAQPSATAPPAKPLELTTHTGRQIRSDVDFAGRPMLVYFGYTFCPDVCPSSLAVFSASLSILEEAKHDLSELAFLFVSLDPDRDTPEALGDYVSAFHPALIGATASRGALDRIAQDWKVAYRLHPPSSDGDYLVDHPSYAFGLDRAHRIESYLWHFASPTKISQQILRLMAR